MNSSILISIGLILFGAMSISQGAPAYDDELDFVPADRYQKRLSYDALDTLFNRRQRK